MSGWKKASIGRIASWELYLPTRKLYCTSVMSELLGLEENSSPRLEDYLSRIHPDDRYTIEKAIKSRFSQTPLLKHRLIDNNNVVRWVAVHAEVVRNNRGGSVLGGVLFEIDHHSTDLPDASEQGCYLSESSSSASDKRTLQLKKYRALAIELAQAQYKDRCRLADLLHDHVQQLLVASKFSLKAAQQNLHTEKCAEMMQRSCMLIDEAVAICRSVAVELNPPILHEASLVGSLEWLIKEMNRKHDLDVDLRAEPCIETNYNQRLLVFEAVREFLFNVVKHSGLRWAEVEARKIGMDMLRVSVIDHGKGFDVAAVDNGGMGMGLSNIRRRVELAGGCVEIFSSQGKGATISVILPLASQDT